jgi:CRISPR-associated protein Cas1
MIKRVIEISHARTHLSVKLGQLLIRSEGREPASIPCEDVGILIVDHQATTFTHSVFTRLLDAGAAVVLCGGDHHPAGMLLPIESNSVQTERFRLQVEAKEPVRKRLWQQLVRAKIDHQAKVVEDIPDVSRAIRSLKDRVRSGDPANIEAQASRRYWPAFNGDPKWHRSPDGPPPNNLLNYGYTVMRAAVARALCAAGLHPSLGLHHTNRYNAFCLADDMVEPFRGYVEAKVRKMAASGACPATLDQAAKAALLETLYTEVEIADYTGPLMVGLHRTMASLQRCYAGEQARLDLPVIWT